jgi:hypothetical protein
MSDPRAQQQVSPQLQQFIMQEQAKAQVGFNAILHYEAHVD